MFALENMLPPKARRVAELGCGRGEVGAAFLRRSPEADYWGFETEPERVREAAGRLPHAVCAEPEALDFAGVGLYEADALAIGGAYLRGLTAARLRGLASIVPEQGQVLLLVPNSGYLRTVLARLAGKGGESLALPPLSYWRELAREAGFASCEVYPQYAPSEDRGLGESPATQAFLKAFTDMCREAGQEVRTDIWARGWLLRLTRPALPQNERMLLHAVVGESLVTARVRVGEPAEALCTEPGVDCIAEKNGKYNEAIDKEYGRVVFLRQRINWKDLSQAQKSVEELRRRGHLLIAEMDDHPSLWREDYEATQYVDFAGVHALQVSTPALAEALRPYNPMVGVFRNELKELPPARDYRAEAREGRPVTLFFGALNRSGEWQDIMPVLNEAASFFGGKLAFRVISDRAFFEALQTERKEFITLPGKDYEGRYVPYDIYRQELHRADIALLPLHDTEFNRGKSDLKFIESAGHGAVVLASPTVYADTVRDGRTGFIYRSPREFAQRLRLLIEEPERRYEMAEAAYRYVRSERLLSRHYQERLVWYRELFARRPELDRALGERMARLRSHDTQEKGKKA